MPTKKRKYFSERLEKSISVGNDQKLTDEYKEYLSSLKALDSTMDVLYEEKDGELPEISAEDQKNLIGKLVTAASAGEKFLNHIKEKKLKIPVSGVVDRLQNTLAKTFVALKDYNPSVPKTLKEIHEESKSTTIDLKERNIKALGNMQNSRIPMTIYTANGKSKSGVFTKATHFSLTDKFKKGLDTAKTQCNNLGAQALDGMLTTIKKTLINNGGKKYDNTKITKDTSNDYVLAYLLNVLKIKHELAHKTKMNPGILKNTLNELGVKTNDISGAAFKTLSNAMDPLIKLPVVINGFFLALPDEARLDNRNSALSAVARLLDSSSLVAKSENMKYIDQNGNRVDGTFMEFAKGIDLGNDFSLAKHINDNPMQTGSAQRNSFIKSLADLQIIDALCLNVDRHYQNMSYRVDKEGNFIGVQGFDNDSSFGRGLLTNEKVRSIRVISESMASKIKNMSSSMLKFSLRGTGLQEPEIDAACKRLNQLKQAIRANMIKTVKDNEFGNLSAGDVTPERNEHNIIHHVLEEMHDVIISRRQSNIPFEPYTEKMPELTKVSTEERRFTAGGLLDTTEKVSEMLNSKISGSRLSDIDKFGRRSEQFTDVLNAAKIIQDMPKTIKNIKGFDSKSMLNGGYVPKEVYDTMDLGYSNLRSTISTYLNKKVRERNASSVETLQGKNPYEQKRIDFAKQLLRLVNEYEDIRKGPVTEADKKLQNKLSEKMINKEIKDMRRQANKIAKNQKNLL